MLDEMIDVEDDILILGMINFYNYVFMVVFCGLVEDGYIVGEWLFNFFFFFEKVFFDWEFIYVFVCYVVMEMVLGGVMIYVDMYYYEDEVVWVMKDVGLRGVFGEIVIGFLVVDVLELYGGFVYVE